MELFQEPKEQTVFLCGKCGRNYKYKKTLRQHQVYECGKEPMFSCQFCPFKSKLKGNLKTHMAFKHSSMLKFSI